MAKLTEKMLSEFCDEMVRLQDVNAASDKKLSAIRELCQRHNHAGVNVGCHELASKVLANLVGQVVTVEGE